MTCPTRSAEHVEADRSSPPPALTFLSLSKAQRHGNRQRVRSQRSSVSIAASERQIPAASSARDHGDHEQHEHDVYERRRVDFGRDSHTRVGRARRAWRPGICCVSSNFGMWEENALCNVTAVPLGEVAFSDFQELHGEILHAVLTKLFTRLVKSL